ncbi:MAG: MFS transporter, partial [Oscillospiraceae bacterium]|nr:MFS transporter [Oscillospiraceae bacterium]
LKPRPEEQGRRFKQPPLDLHPARMLRTRDYRLIVGSAALATPAVLLFSPILVQLGQERGLSEAAAHWAVVLGSVGSAAGRLLMPLLSDRIGRRTADLWLFAGLAGLSVLFAFARGPWVAACYAGLTFCYSGEAALLPALGTDRFGLPHAGVNYGFLALGMSAGSLGFPLLARALGLEAGRHWLAAGAAVAGAACIARLDEPDKARKAKGPGKTP